MDGMIESDLSHAGGVDFTTLHKKKYFCFTSPNCHVIGYLDTYNVKPSIKERMVVKLVKGERVGDELGDDANVTK